MKFPKTPKIVSKKIRASAKGENCTIRYPGCNNQTETTVFAHLNSRWKGMGNKSPDLFGVYACDFCHRKLDVEKRVPVVEELKALQETQMRLYQKGLIKIK
ncbi:MAG TPA: nuclease domain-containing protein [Massilibacterium sp.]|nr:nuclease domain-containing protein [Massilibacterium sp.]